VSRSARSSVTSPKGNADKAAVIAAVKALGFDPADDNEADALALLHWAIAQGLGGK
jgi:Holliday junction resolvasome RuvABC endonuclease subunit